MLPKSPKLFCHFHCSGRAEKRNAFVDCCLHWEHLVSCSASRNLQPPGNGAEFFWHLLLCRQPYNWTGISPSPCWHRQHQECRELAKTDLINSRTKGIIQNKLNSKSLRELLGFLTHIWLCLAKRAQGLMMWFFTYLWEPCVGGLDANKSVEID